MKIRISKSDVKGEVTVPPSKSVTIRALFCAALSKGESQIKNPLVSDDTSYAADVLSKIGVQIADVDGVWHVQGGKFRLPSEDLYCGESATTLRMMTALVGLLPGTIRLTCGPGLTQRPIRALVDSLKMLGINGTTATITSPPVTIRGGTFKGGVTEIAGNVSSQYITALLLIGSFAPVETVVRLTTPLTSKPYILMTLQVMKMFNVNVLREGNGFIVKRQRYEPATVSVEGDWSSASYFLALGALSEQGLLVKNISTSSRQGDRVILDHLRNMGAGVKVVDDTVFVQKTRQLKSISVDLSDSIDLLPTMAVLAAFAKGVTELRGIQRARIKESNRVTAVREGLAKLGVQVFESKEFITIRGLETDKKGDDDEDSARIVEEKPEDFFDDKETKVKPDVLIDSYNDHRIAMAFAVMGAAMGGVIIKDAECVSKTYPTFWEALQKVGGILNVDEQ